MRLKSMLMGSAIAVACAVSLLGASAADAALIDWTLWSGSAPGTAVGTAGTVGVLYTGEIQSLDPNYPTWTPTSSYVGGDVGNAPPQIGGIIQLFGGGGANAQVDTITFSHAVTNPVMAIWSLGQGGDTAEFDFAQPYSIQAGGPSAEYGGSTIVVCLDGGVCGTEGNGTIEFLGTYNEIQWVNPVFEDWYGFTVGVAATPLPSTWTMLIAGFIALGFFAYRGTKQGSAAIAAA
jgi:hypothetical protein